MPLFRDAGEGRAARAVHARPVKSHPNAGSRRVHLARAHVTFTGISPAAWNTKKVEIRARGTIETPDGGAERWGERWRRRSRNVPLENFISAAGDVAYVTRDPRELGASN